MKQLLLTSLLVAGLVQAGCDGREPLLKQLQGISPGNSNSESIEILSSTAHPEPEKPFVLEIKAVWPVTAEVIEPLYPNYITELIVRDYQHHSQDDGVLQQTTVQLAVEATLEGVYKIPSFPVVLQYENTQHVLRTLPLYLEISLEAASGVTDIRDIKPLMRPGNPSQNALWALLPLLLLLGGLLYWLWYKRHKNSTIDPMAQIEQTLDRLYEQLASEKLNRESAYTLSKSVRFFIQRKTRLPAAAMTGTELQNAILQLQDELGPLDFDSPWRALSRLCIDLETIKYTPEGHSDKSVHLWVQEIRRSLQMIQKAEAAQQAASEASQNEVTQ